MISSWAKHACTNDLSPNSFCLGSFILFYFYNHREYIEKAIKWIAKKKYKRY